MRKSLLKLLFIFLIISPFFLSLTNVKAQEDAASDTPFEISFMDYQTQIEEYQTAHQEYILRRSQYMRFRTLQSKQDAIAATVKMMQKRDDVTIAYLKTLKERLNEADGVNDQKRSALNVRVDAESGWFTDHKGKIPSAGTLEDLIKDNKLANDRNERAQILYYETLSVISSGKTIDFKERLADVFGQLKLKIDEIKGEQRNEYILSDEKLLTLDRWVFEADNKFLRTEEKQAEADILIAGYIAQRVKATMTYSAVMLRLGETQQFIKEAGSYMTEIVREIKTNDK